MPHTIRMNASFPYTVSAVLGDKWTVKDFHIVDVEFVLDISYERDRNGEVFDFSVENIGIYETDRATYKPVLRFLPDTAWQDHLIQSALEYFRSSKFGEEVQEKVDEEHAWEMA